MMIKNSLNYIRVENNNTNMKKSQNLETPYLMEMCNNSIEEKNIVINNLKNIKSKYMENITSNNALIYFDIIKLLDNIETLNLQNVNQAINSINLEILKNKVNFLNGRIPNSDLRIMTPINISKNDVKMIDHYLKLINTRLDSKTTYHDIVFRINNTIDKNYTLPQYYTQSTQLIRTIFRNNPINPFQHTNNIRLPINRSPHNTLNINDQQTQHTQSNKVTKIVANNINKYFIDQIMSHKKNPFSKPNFNNNQINQTQHNISNINGQQTQNTQLNNIGNPNYNPINRYQHNTANINGQQTQNTQLNNIDKIDKIIMNHKNNPSSNPNYNYDLINQTPHNTSNINGQQTQFYKNSSLQALDQISNQKVEGKNNIRNNNKIDNSIVMYSSSEPNTTNNSQLSQKEGHKTIMTSSSQFFPKKRYSGNSLEKIVDKLVESIFIDNEEINTLDEETLNSINTENILNFSDDPDQCTTNNYTESNIKSNINKIK